MESLLPRSSRQVQARQVGTSDSDTLKIAFLGGEVSFDCSVESTDATEVSIWWQKDDINLTITDSIKYSIVVS